VLPIFGVNKLDYLFRQLNKHPLQMFCWDKGKVDWLNPLTDRSDPILGKRKLIED